MARATQSAGAEISAVGGIVDAGGGLRLVIAPRDSFRHHVLKGERLFVLPNVGILQPASLGHISDLVRRMREYIAMAPEPDAP